MIIRKKNKKMLFIEKDKHLIIWKTRSQQKSRIWNLWKTKRK